LNVNARLAACAGYLPLEPDLSNHRGDADAPHPGRRWRRIALAAPAAAFEDLRAPGAKVEKLAGDFSFTEGPTADAAGNVFFTDQPNDRILKWSVDGKLSTFLEPAGRSNGMYFDRSGNLIACADEKNELWSIAKDGKVTVVWKGNDGKNLNRPNDVWVHPSGSLYSPTRSTHAPGGRTRRLPGRRTRLPPFRRPGA
jgi:sugar lactone lactonase YvrE